MKNYKIEYLSLPFYFDHIGIEFCRSLSKSHNKKNLLFGIGIEDKEAWICEIDKKYIKYNMLKNISTFSFL